MAEIEKRGCGIPCNMQPCGLGTYIRWQHLIIQLIYIVQMNKEDYSLGLSCCSYPQYQANSSPIVCVVLTLDSWKYFSGKQGPIVQNVNKIAQSSLYSWTMYMNEINKELPPYVTLFATRWHTSSNSVKAIQSKHWEEDVWLLDFAFQSNSFKCLVLIPHRQLGNHLLDSGKSYSPTYLQDFM